MADKHIIFLFSAIVLVPMGILIARNNPRVLNLIFCALVFGTTQPESLFSLPTDINFLSREWYRGTTRGIEVSYLDLLALVLLFSSLAMRAREGIPFGRPPGYRVLKVYFIWAFLTVLIVSEPKIFGVFELTKVFRAILVFLAVWTFMRSPDQVRLFVYVLVAIVFYETTVALYDRYVLGVHRISATLPHPNALSMYCLQIFPFMISVWFARDVSLRLRYFCLFSCVLIAGLIILTVSRTGFASLAVLTFLSLLMNVRNRWTARNIGIVVVVFAIGSAMVFKSWDSLSSRFEGTSIITEYGSQEGDRGSYFRKGWPALVDSPVFGVGLNNWSYWISNRYAGEAGYYAEVYDSTEYSSPSYFHEAPAHNLYLITAVELGWIGFLLLIVLFGRWLHISGTGMRKSGVGLLDRVRLGAFLSLIGVLMQSVTEWEFRVTSMYFLAHIIISIAAFIYYTQRKVN